MLQGPSGFLGNGCTLGSFGWTHTLGPQQPSELTKTGGELPWGQIAIAICIQGIKYVFQFLQAEWQLLMEPLKTSQTTLVNPVMTTESCLGLQSLCQKMSGDCPVLQEPAARS